MNNKTINKPKQNLRKKGFRTNSQVNIHKPSSLYTLEIEEKYLFKLKQKITKNNNYIHYKSYLNQTSSKKQSKTNHISELYTSSTITTKSTKLFNGTDSQSNKIIDNYTSKKSTNILKNETTCFLSEKSENHNDQFSRNKTSEIFQDSIIKKKHRHKARSVARPANIPDNNMNVNKTFINVYCRIRPLNNLERMHTNDNLCVNLLTETQLEIINNNNNNTNNISDNLTQYFSFDEIFPTTSTQEEIYTKTSKDIIDSVLQGYNGTIMAYGQTSSGKTFTIQGENIIPNKEGIIPRAIKHIFLKISQEKSNYKITASFLEIYMEKINDLFELSRTNLQIQEDADHKLHILDLSEINLTTYESFLNAYKKAAKNRTTSLTAMNDYSSRSHCIMIINIYNTTKSNHGKLFIVDLAGSEKISKINCKGLNIEETKIINKSLSQLGLIIKALTTNTSHIPYRSSKLTRLLTESLGGNAKTSLILTCSPSLYNINETLSTLRFGKRAKMIKNKPVINKEESKAELKYTIELLQKELQLKNEMIKTMKINKDIQNTKINESEFDLSICENEIKNIKHIKHFSYGGLSSEFNWTYRECNNSIDKSNCDNNSLIYPKENIQKTKECENESDINLNLKSKIFNDDIKLETESYNKHNNIVNRWKSSSLEMKFQNEFSINNTCNNLKNSTSFEIDSQTNNSVLSSYSRNSLFCRNNAIYSDKTLKVNIINNNSISANRTDFNLMKYSLLFIIMSLLLFNILHDYI
jgi:hypothetical protein